MKRITLFLTIIGCLSITNNAVAENLPNRLLADFEGNTTGLFTSQGTNITMTPFANPSQTGINTSDYVLKIEASASVAAWEAVYSRDDLVLPINSDANVGYRYLHFKVYKSFASNVLAGFYISGGEKLSPEKSNTQTNTWEYIVVDLLGLTDSWNIQPGTYNKMNFNINKSGPAGAYTGYIDDIYLSTSTTPITNTPVNTEDLDDKLVMDFEGGVNLFTAKDDPLAMAVEENPSKTGENTSNYALKITSSATTSWHSLYSINDKITNIFEISTDPTVGYRYLHFKVYKSLISKMLWYFYDESGTAGALNAKYCAEKANTKINEWEYLVIDLLELNGGAYNISPGTHYRIRFNMNTNGSGAYTGYIDDIYLSISADKRAQTPTSVKNAKTDNDISVSRLDNNTVKIAVNAELKGNLKLNVYNMQGQLLQSIGNVSSAETLELNLPDNNLYLLRATGNKTFTVKF